MNMIEKKVESLCRHMEKKKWTKEAEDALRKLQEEDITLLQKADVMKVLFPEHKWTVASIASKEKKL